MFDIYNSGYSVLLVGKLKLLGYLGYACDAVNI